MELTDSDRASLDSVLSLFPRHSGVPQMIESAYRAGMAAMAERCAQACKGIAYERKRDMSRETIHEFLTARECEAACRALAQPSLPLEAAAAASRESKR